MRGAFAGCLRRAAFSPYLAAMSIGFKEWTLVCDALGSGAQSIIIRKGGIAEGRAGFRFQHPEFYLFPTLFHEQVSKLKLPPSTPLPALRADGQHAIALRVRVEWTEDIADLAVVQGLAPFHCWQDSEIEKRFHYELPSARREAGDGGATTVAGGVSIALVRVEKMSAPFIFPDSPKFGGCRSWIELPEPPEGITFSPVLDDATHRGRDAAIRAALEFGMHRVG